MDAEAALDMPPAIQAAIEAKTFQGWVNSYMAKSTWQKYASGYRAFCAFELHYETSFSWPLSKACWRLFATWCMSIRGLQPSTTKSYMSALKFIHHMKGLPIHDPADDFLLQCAFKGAAKAAFASPPPPATRRIVTFALLRLLGHRIASTSWSELTKQVVWSACTLAFFSSARLGELLSYTTYTHDPTADLTWADIVFNSPDSLLVRLKCTMSGDLNGEFLDVFVFPGFNCCPVAGIQQLKRLQKEAGCFSPDLPVFRFATGKNLTPGHFNNILSQLLVDICVPGQDTISCHSFRAGIPSTLALFPDLANCDDIQGWGRWHSECFNRYTRLRHEQKRAIFGKISAAILAAPGGGVA
jgi:hypothetical protein